MMIRSCFLLVAATGIFTCAIAQQQPDTDATKVIAQEEFLRLLVPPGEVEGRANLFSNWQQGEVFLTHGRFVSGIMFNYDVLNNTLLVLTEEKEFSLNPIAVDSIQLDNTSLVLINPIVLNGTGMDLLLLRVYDGHHLSLFRNTLAEIMDGEVRTSSATKLVYDRINDVQIQQERSHFLLDKSSNELRQLEGKRKALRQWENGDQLVEFVKSQNLDLKDERDLIRVIQYYEQVSYAGTAPR